MPSSHACLELPRQDSPPWFTAVEPMALAVDIADLDAGNYTLYRCRVRNVKCI